MGLSTATRKASVSLAEREGDEVVIVSARLKDVVSSAAQLHGWNVASQQNVAVQVNLPTAEQEAERRARHDRLDQLTAKLLAFDQARKLYRSDSKNGALVSSF